MALTQISTKGIKDGTISSADLSDQSVTLDKLPHGTSSNDGKFLRANNGADPSFETVTVATATGNANVIQTTDGSGAFTASNTFTISGDVFTGHDINLARDSSNADPVVGAAAQANVTFRTNQNNASGAGVASILDINGLQMGRMTQYVKLAAPTDQSGQTSYTFTFPPISGTSGQALTTNGSGTTSWTTIDTDLVNDTTPQLGGDLDTNGNDISFHNDHKVKFGNDNDMQIYHSNSGDRNVINSNKKFEIYANGDLELKQNTGELYFKGVHSSGATELYHDNSKKLHTHSGGLTISGSIHMDDNNKYIAGTGDDLQIYHDGSDSYIDEAGTGGLKLRTSQLIARRYDNNAELFTATAGGSIDLYHNGSKKFETTTGGATVTGNVFVTGSFRGDDNSKLDLGSSNDLQIHHDGTNSIIEDVNDNPLWIQTDGAIRLTKDGASAYYATFNPGGAVDLYHNGSKKFETTSAGVTVTGALTATGDVTAFSDETLKKDITTIENAIDICSKLRGVSYKWIKDDKASIGVIAQEVEKVIPEVVHTTEHEGAEVKSVDYGKIIGVLINAINEQQAKWDEWMELLKEIKKMEDKLIEVIGSY